MSKLLLIVTLVIAVMYATAVHGYAGQRASSAANNAQPQSAEWATGYSADFAIRHASDPSRNCTGRMYVNALVEPRGFRRESVCGKQRRVSIWTTEGTLVVIDPDAKVYWKPRTKARLVAERQDASDASKEFIAREKLEGRDVDHYEQLMEQSDGTTVVAHVWGDLRLRSNSRAVNPNETFELKNIKEGAQPAYLFAIPDGFREIDPPKEP